MLGDLNIAEPKALIGFAGPRVIEQTIRQKLPEGFQRSEFLLEHGMLDLIVDRREMKAAIARVLRFAMPRAGTGGARRLRPGPAVPEPAVAPAPASVPEPLAVIPPTPSGAGRPHVEFLFSLERFGMKFGLANIAALCAALGNPQDAFPSIIVAGTNGKGSVTAMVDTALRAAGHLQRALHLAAPAAARRALRHRRAGGRHRRARCGGRPHPRRRGNARRVGRAALRRPSSSAPRRSPSSCSATAGVDVAVLEVGLGGRLDSTNIVSPIAAAIVSIDFDHEEQLGHSLASIAAEKAGVIKPGIPVVCGPLPDEALEVIASVCAGRGATLVRTDTDAALAGRVESMPVSLPGEHQRANAAVALRLLELIDGDRARGLPVGADARRAGLTTTVWPGRIERFDVSGCPVVLDAAHNPAGARALASYLREAAPQGVTLVFGAMRDKAVREMLTALAPAARAILCATAPSPRAMPAEELAALARDIGLRAEAVPNPVDALARACGYGRTVVVAGSIFLVGPVREWLARDILR